MSEPTRHQLGQWFTPEPVADLALALALQGASPEARILDPSCGDGVFLRRAASQGIAQRRLFGVDLDPRAIEAARAVVPGATLVRGDFFESTLRDEKVEVVVGNPPYVRQERLDARTKLSMVRQLRRDWPQLEAGALEKLVGRGDLAAPFLLRILSRLRQGGRAALVLSSAFFDSGYGELLWRLLGKVASLSLVVDAPKERWFPDAAVNAIIAVVDASPSKRDLCVARLEATSAEAARVIAGGGRLQEVAELRFARADSPESWAGALRAPAAWFDFVEAAGDALTTLGELAEVRRGITSGANDIFYIEREQARSWRLPVDFLRPLLRSPGKSGQGRIEFDWQHSRQLALVIDGQASLGEHESVLRYLQSFAGAAERSTLKARKPWWSLNVRPARVFLSKAYAQRFVQPYCARPVVADQRVYCLHPRGGLDPELLAAVLNATPTALALESLGRASMGQGALEWSVADASKLPVLDPRRLDEHAGLLAAFRQVRTREVGPVASEAERADRRELDRCLLSNWPALLGRQDDIAEALIAACTARQQRAKV